MGHLNLDGIMQAQLTHKINKSAVLPSAQFIIILQQHHTTDRWQQLVQQIAQHVSASGF